MSKRKSLIAMRVVVIGILPALTACAGNKLPASLAGVCGVFQDPGFAVRGATRKDQTWISSTQETGIQVCDWKRPARIKAKVATVEIIDVGETTPRPKAAPKKRKWWQR